jgi:hypothetical protein
LSTRDGENKFFLFLPKNTKPVDDGSPPRSTKRPLAATRVGASDSTYGRAS